MNGLTTDRLTERQKDCLRLVAQGYTSKEIGRQLELSPSTVDNHILAATQLLGAMSRAEAGRILASAEIRQKMPSQPAALAEPAVSGLLSAPAEGQRLSVINQKLWYLPPVGGYNNDLDATERTIRIIQVAATGFVTVIGLAVLIAGAFTLLG